ncbi:hypothetical protein A9996_07850 [Gelidibacter algens]|nr:DUF4136 domain-containing protein [Gelidibacter algens]OBX25833.1 hypothetical protein A9996_07850 [Gelidibacter algens]
MIISSICLFVLSCASVRVNYDYEKTTDFNAYTTYNYYGTMDMGMSELDSARLLDALDLGLQAKGLSLSDAPDFLINIKSSEFQESQRNNVGVGVGGGGGSVGGGISIGIPVGQAKINREIVFEFVDENKSGLFWQAISESAYHPNATPQARETQFKAIVAKVLAAYPPNSKK